MGMPVWLPDGTLREYRGTAFRGRCSVPRWSLALIGALVLGLLLGPGGEAAAKDPPSAGDSCGPGNYAMLNGVMLTCHKRNGKWVFVAPASTSTAAPTSSPKLGGRCQSGQQATTGGYKWRCRKQHGKYVWTRGSRVPVSTSPTVAAVAGASKQACLNAWWDKEFARVVPQLVLNQDAPLTDRIWEYCHRNFIKFMTPAERDQAYATYFQQVGQLVADEVVRVSSATGMTPCLAVQEILKPHYITGQGLVGWDAGGYLPILYKQWQGGPMIGKVGGNDDNCASGKISIQLRRHYQGRHEGSYYPPLGTADANWVLTDEQQQISWVNGAVCLVWSPRFGNTGVGSAARVVGYNYTNMGDGVNMVTADNEVMKCEFNAEKAAGMPVIWKADASPTALRAVPAEYAGTWHTMAENCSWTLKPVDGGPTVTWTPADGPYVTVALRGGDQFASTCELEQNEWEHMIVAPDGLFPLQSLSQGPRRPTTPATCRYTVTDVSALRSPPSAGSLTPYHGETANFDVSTGRDGLGAVLRAVGCGHWDLV